jgi:hypothetical protein
LEETYNKQKNKLALRLKGSKFDNFKYLDKVEKEFNSNIDFTKKNEFEDLEIRFDRM